MTDPIVVYNSLIAKRCLDDDKQSQYVIIILATTFFRRRYKFLSHIHRLFFYLYSYIYNIYIHLYVYIIYIFVYIYIYLYVYILTLFTEGVFHCEGFLLSLGFGTHFPTRASSPF